MTTTKLRETGSLNQRPQWEKVCYELLALCGLLWGMGLGLIIGAQEGDAFIKTVIGVFLLAMGTIAIIMARHS